jgi:hypothetical protein
MTQVPPKYRHMASCANPVVQNHLRGRYGSENVCWPIVWLKDDAIVFYTFELTQYCDTNSLHGNRPVSLTSKGCHFVSYVDDPRIIEPPESLLVPSIDSKYDCSYDYVTQSEYVTVDLDYVWQRQGEWFALEFTTWYKRFFSRGEAERLVSMLNRRGSWQSVRGPSAIMNQIEAASDLSVCRFIMACVNTRGQVDNNINTEGNAYWFDLDPSQVRRLVDGKLPENASFGTFGSFLQSL